MEGVNLVPWQIRAEHRWAYPLTMLRLEARRRRGDQLREADADKLATFIARLQVGGLVVHYDPDTPEGFHLVTARAGIDTDLVRTPDHPIARPVAGPQSI